MASRIEELVKGLRVPTYRYHPRVLAKSMHFLKTRPARRLTNMATLQEMVKPLVAIPKPVSVLKAILKGQEATVDDVNLFLPDARITWAVTYKNNMKRSLKYSYEQKINGAVDSGEDLDIYAGEEVTHRKSALAAKDPSYVIGRAEVSMEPKIKMLTDSVSKSFGVGILRFKDKPVAEYPAPDSENVVAGFDVWAQTFAAEFGPRTPVLIGEKAPAMITGPTWEFLHPFVKVGDRLFKHPAADNVLRTTLNVKNTWDTPITAWVPPAGSLMAVVYEDHVHLSIVSFLPTPSDRVDLKPDEDVDFVTNMVFPDWAYGKMVFGAEVVFEYTRLWPPGAVIRDRAIDGGHIKREIGLQEFP